MLRIEPTDPGRRPKFYQYLVIVCKVKAVLD
jgi:hypothetical protein